MNTITDLKKTAETPHRFTPTQNQPPAKDAQQRPRPTGLTRAEVRQVVEQMIG